MDILLRRTDNYALDVKTERRADEANSKAFQLIFVTSFSFIVVRKFFLPKYGICTVTYFKDKISNEQVIPLYIWVFQ